MKNQHPLPTYVRGLSNIRKNGLRCNYLNWKWYKEVVQHTLPHA